MEEHPDTPVVQMDRAEGRKGGKVLLTIHFVNCSLMFAFLREHNDAQSVIDLFNDLEKILDEKFTVEKIIDTLKNYNFRNFPGFGYVPLYTPNNLIHASHDKTGINTNYEILNYKKI